MARKIDAVETAWPTKRDDGLVTPPEQPMHGNVIPRGRVSAAVASGHFSKESA